MINLTINKKVYKVPSKLSEITLKQFQALKEESDNNVESFSKFANIPLKELNKCPQDEVLFFISQVFDLIQKIDMEDINNEDPKPFKVGTTKYYPRASVDKENMGLYIGCSSYMERLTGQEYLFYPYMMAFYCPRKGEEDMEDQEEIEKRAEVMRGANVIDALRVNAFFLNNSKNYERAFQQYFQEELTQTNQQQDTKN
tara:strand:- start:49 stop:645 length:597 start_codon:yes stop_codon:yes gene_type:complete